MWGKITLYNKNIRQIDNRYGFYHTGGKYKRAMSIFNYKKCPRPDKETNRTYIVMN